ncbi:GTPase IMAP family member 8 [Antennarius striatus]|uniref:GTPase IMAP family member 8 n=1 Tax=Antennarius striatus TaxID=241820 RepID=UPI0035B4124E
MATPELPAWGGWRPSPLRIVLLGGRNSGKSSVGNFLLGKNDFATTERILCSRRLGLVGGRWLTVVDTPGWWCDFRARDTSELVKREILSSVFLCSPGPHVFLITIKASSAFTERRRRAVEEHVGLLGEEVWSHCMVVFTSDGGSLQMGGDALRWLARRCGRRCHSVSFGGDTETMELLEKIQKLVAENGNEVFEMRDSILLMAAEEKRGVEERARERFMRMRKQRALMRERLRHVTNIRIVLVGARGSGKTTTLNTILSRKKGDHQKTRTAQCQSVIGAAFGRQLTVVDTPGWWMNYFSDETPVFDRREMVFGLSLCRPGPHVFLLVIRLDRAFTEVHRRAAEEHLALFGERVWSRVVVLFSFGDWLGGVTLEQCIESEGAPLRWLVERCGNRYHLLNNRTQRDEFQVRELIGKIEETLADSSDFWHFELERKALEQMEVKMRRETEEAKERAMKKEKQRQKARSQMEELNPLPEVRLVLVGAGKTGKSSCGNTILRRDCFDTETPTVCCSEQRAKINGKTVAVLDTPGCFSVTPDLLVPSTILLLVINVSSSFKRTQGEALKEQLEMGGGWAWRQAVVVFSHGDWLGDTSVERRVESEGRALKRLVDKCGNRYHVLDNKRRRDGAQVDELIGLIEETLVGERLAVLQGGDHMWRGVCLAGCRRRNGVTMSKDLKALRSPMSSNSIESTINANQRSCSGNGGQVVTLRSGRQARTRLDGVTSCLAPGSKQRLRWTIHLPVYFPSDDLPTESRLFSYGSPKNLLVLPQVQRRALVGDGAIDLKSLLHPTLRERTMRRLGDSGGLQALIDQWGHSSLEELEDFIDSYFQMVWEESMGSFPSAVADRPATDRRPVWEETRQEDTLMSIDRKLEKLEVLEEIRREMTEIRRSLEQGWKTIRDLTGKKEEERR